MAKKKVARRSVEPTVAETVPVETKPRLDIASVCKKLAATGTGQAKVEKVRKALTDGVDVESLGLPSQTLAKLRAILG